MTTRNNPRSNSFRDPGRHDVITDLSFDAYEIAGANANLRCVRRMDPERVGMRDLIEPLCVCTTRVNLHGEAKRRDQDCLVFFEIIFVNMTLEVNRYCQLRPAPAIHC